MKFLDLSKFGKQKCSFYFALEQYLLEKDSPEIFFFWDIYPSVIIGRNQLIQNEVNLDFIKEHNIQLFRRPSGGGCVFADEGDFMFSFVSKNINVQQAFSYYLDKVCKALNNLNVKAYFSGRNDLLLDGKKFSGNAFYVKNNQSVMHGTFMYDVNIDYLVRSITPNKEKLISKGIESVRQRVTNLKDYVKMSMEELKASLASQMCDETIYLTDEELTIVLAKEEQFLLPSWIEGNNPPYEIKKEFRFPTGLVRFTYEVRKNKIYNLKISGDFFSTLDIEDFAKMFDNVTYSENIIYELLSKIKVDDYITGLTSDDIVKLLFTE
jgi:lipoyltransferase/lipoate-protein ligase